MIRSDRWCKANGRGDTSVFCLPFIVSPSSYRNLDQPWTRSARVKCDTALAQTPISVFLVVEVVFLLFLVVLSLFSSFVSLSSLLFPSCLPSGLALLLVHISTSRYIRFGPTSVAHGASCSGRPATEMNQRQGRASKEGTGKRTIQETKRAKRQKKTRRRAGLHGRQ